MGWGHKIKSHTLGQAVSNREPNNRTIVIDTIPDCAYVRFGHESCTRRRCHAALMSVDSTPNQAEINKPSRSLSKGALKTIWRRVKSLKSKSRLWPSPSSREHICAAPLQPLESSTADSIAAKRVLLQARRMPQPLSCITNLQSDHGSFTSASYRANSSTSQTWTSSNQNYHHGQRLSWSSTSSDSKRNSRPPLPRLLLDHPYYHPHWSQSFSPLQSSIGSEWKTHLSTTPLAHYYSLYSSPRYPLDPYRHKMQQRQILSSVLRDLP